MFDPISMGLMAAGTLFSNFGASRVDKSNRRDVAYTGAEYEKERANQSRYTGENEGTVGDTLNLYGRGASDARDASAIATRQKMYTSPLESMDFNHAMPSDFDPNSLVAARNAQTGAREKAAALTMAGSRANLEGHGDAQQLGNILAANNAAKIGMVSRIAQGSQRAGSAQQALLPGKLQANQQNAGATWNTIGDWLKMAAMVSAGTGGFGAGNGAASGTQNWLAQQGTPSWLNYGYQMPDPMSGPPLPIH